MPRRRWYGRNGLSSPLSVEPSSYRSSASLSSWVVWASSGLDVLRHVSRPFRCRGGGERISGNPGVEHRQELCPKAVLGDGHRHWIAVDIGREPCVERRRIEILGFEPLKLCCLAKLRTVAAFASSATSGFPFCRGEARIRCEHGHNGKKLRSRIVILWSSDPPSCHGDYGGAPRFHCRPLKPTSPQACPASWVVGKRGPPDLFTNTSSSCTGSYLS